MLYRSLTIMAVLPLATLHASTIHSFDATAGAPQTQGWAAASGILSGATVTDLGHKAWQMTGNNCCGYWYDGLTSTQWTDAFNLGWSLSGFVRNTGTQGAGYIFLDVPNGLGVNRYDLEFGNDGTNGWAGLAIFTDSSNPALKVTFSGNDYHLLDMRYDPVSHSASLFVDGTLTLSGYTGHNQFREGHGPAFGVFGTNDQAFFSNVQFSIGSPSSAVPEPASCAFVACGLGILLRRRFRAR